MLPEIPAMKEFVPGYEASSWYGISAAKNVSTAIVEKLNEEINAGLADPKLKARLVELGVAPLPGSPADFGKLVADETKKWAKVVEFTRIQPT
jgi:tripartite-type tricarboxylate transporter receptor subunit TctC